MSRPLIPIDRRGIRAVAGAAIFWTPARVAVIEARYNRPDETNKAIAADLGCTTAALRSMAAKHGLTRKRVNPGYWRPEPLDLLRRLYGVIPTRELARLIGRSRCAVHRKARELGLSYGENARLVALQQARTVRELRVLLALHIRPHSYLTEAEAEAVLGLPIRDIHQMAVRHAAAGTRELDQLRRMRA